MKPTRALGRSESTPSSIPSPALSTGQTATFLPAIRCTLVRSSGVSTSASSVGRSFVASYVSNRVTSFASLRKWTVGVSLSRRYESLCWTSGCVTTVTPLAVTATTGASALCGLAKAGRLANLEGETGRVACSRDVRSEAAEAWVERPLVAERLGAGRERPGVAVGERLGDDPPDLAEVLLVEAAHRG